MIYYAHSKKEGAEKLADKYNLRELPAKDYISEDTLKGYTTFEDVPALFDAIWVHTSIHAFVLSDLKLHFHPDAIVALVRDAHTEVLSSLV